MKLHDFCENCRFWRQYDAQGTGHGECRRRAPSVGKDGLWPHTRQLDWCGEHEREFTGHDVEREPRQRIKVDTSLKPGRLPKGL